MENNFAPFYVGQTVVCIEKRATRVKYGSTYVVSDVAQLPCKCWVIRLTGISRNQKVPGVHCYQHPSSILNTGCDWFTVDHFAPIESQFQSISFEKVIEKDNPLIGVN